MRKKSFQSNIFKLEINYFMYFALLSRTIYGGAKNGHYFSSFLFFSERATLVRRSCVTSLILTVVCYCILC